MKMSRIEKLFVNRPGRQRERVRLADELLSSIKMDNGREFLEVGCGVGAVAHHVAEKRALNVTGIDIDPEQIAAARARAGGRENPRFQEADATNLPFEGGRFDVVLSFMAMHHIGDCGTAFREIARVLRPGGAFVCADIVLSKPIALLSELVGHSHRLPPLDQVSLALTEAGFVETRPPEVRGALVGQFRGSYAKLH